MPKVVEIFEIVKISEMAEKLLVVDIYLLICLRIVKIY